MMKVKSLTARRIRARIVLAATALAGCDGATAPRDTTPPVVTVTSPANSAVGVLLDAVLAITFGEAMTPSSVNGTTVTLTKTSGGASVGGVVSYDAQNHTALFTPSTSLDYDTGYTLTVTVAAMDVAGNAMSTNYQTSFTTIQKIFGKPYFQGTNTISDSGQPQIHVHIRFSQSGHTVSRPADCEPLPLANCDLLPRNAAGSAAVGNLDDQGLAATITQISGTFSDPAISFTFTLANGRTFSFTGTVMNSDTMTGTLSGTTLAPIQIVLSRELDL